MIHRNGLDIPLRTGGRNIVAPQRHIISSGTLSRKSTGAAGPAGEPPGDMKSVSLGLASYLSSLTVTQGRRAGQRFICLPWQLSFVAGAWAEGISEASLSVGRGNGKTALLSGIAAATLDGPLMVPRGETVIVASSFEQARIAFEHVVAFMGNKLDDKRRWKVWDTAQQARIEDRQTGARVRCVGSDPRRAHGLAPVLVLADEPSQWPETTGEKMVAALRTAAGKQPHSKFVALGTRPARADHWFAKMLNPAAGRYSQVHAADDADDIGNPAEWIKGNPSMLHMPDLRRAIQAEAEQAQHDPALLASFRALRLNLGTSETADRDMLISAELWAELLKLPEAPPEGRRIWGCDLGGASAMSAICCVWGTGRLQSVAMVGREPDLQSRALRDGAGDLYQTAYDTGELLISNKRIPNIQQLFEEAEARFGGRPDALVVDRWRLAELRDALDDTSWQAVRLIVRGQGFRDGAEDVRAWSKAVVERRVNPVQPARLLTHALAEAVVITDAAGNSKLAQNTEGGRRKRARDDCAAAAILAVAHAGLDKEQAPASVSYGGLI